jgi:hypothetical protein
VVADPYRSLFEAFEEIRVVDEFQNRDTHAFFWEGRLEGCYVAGADRLRIDGTGKVLRDHRRRATAVGRGRLPHGRRVLLRPPATRPADRAHHEDHGTPTHPAVPRDRRDLAVAHGAVHEPPRR